MGHGTGMVPREQAEIMLETFHFLQEQGCINFGALSPPGWTAALLLGADATEHGSIHSASWLLLRRS